MDSFSLTKFQQCLDIWAKQNEKGTQCLSRQSIGKPSFELESIISNLKETLDTMFEEYRQMREKLGLEETVEDDDSDSDYSDDEEVNMPEELSLLRHCVFMYDQEFMIKECIRGIVSKDGFATKQHLAGCIALWKSESYLDDELQTRIKGL
ncbi:hypothetical protein BDB01DRAFT_219976 [Pilobolus umbonatus]|nr:hypothetical protein BDB01DRAFT_219976 [Pilobolus umbonatus]